MQKKCKLVLITILAIFMSIALFNSRASAANTTVTVSPSKTTYTINGSERVYRYVESQGNYNNIYCFNHGGVLNRGSSYTVSSDLYNMTSEQINNVFGSVQNYNKALWVIDNMVINQNQNKDEISVMVSQLKEAVHSDVAINAVKSQYNVANVTYGDLDNVINHVYSNGWYDVFYSVQQSVIWNYTTNSRQFNGLTKLNGGYDLQGKYYMWLYTALNAVANTKGEYNSPNKSNSVVSTINNLTMDSKSATIDTNNRKIGPFIINGYNKEIMTQKEYTIKINGTTLKSSDYTTSFDGKNLYITVKNNSYNLDSAKVDVSMNITATTTSGTYLYKKYSQDIISIDKNTVPKKLTGSTEDTEFDLRLIKNISQVWNVNDSKANVKFDLNSDVLKTRNIQRVSSLKNGSTTEIWNINKCPVDVSTGDIVKYNITIANEGSLDGYATKVTDYIADGLELVSKDELVKLGIVNQNDEYYGWKKENSENGFTAISTNYLADKKINAFNKNTDTVDTKVIYIYCKVTSNNAGNLLKNVAEITEEKATNLNGKSVTDRDSTPGNIKMSNLSSDWKGNSGNKDIQSTDINKQYSYPGKEDDDDFDTVKVQDFDLALTKQIASIEYSNGTKTDLTRLINIEKTKLYNKVTTTANYNMNKSLVNVNKDAIVTYKITVYNEGSIDGYAKEITDYLPSGLEFYSSEVNGTDYKWNAVKNSDGTTTVKTNYLSDKCISSYKKNYLSSNFVELKCKVSTDKQNHVLTNVSEITDYGYLVGNTYVQANKAEVDVDSVESNVNLNTNKESVSDIISMYEKRVNDIGFEKEYIDKTKTNYEDDDDFENIIIRNKSLDLALRKSISAVNGNTVINSYNLTENRLPKVTGESALTALSTGNAEYYHNKEAIEVNKNDEITYTIRVYNEGNENDYCGYTKEITDYLPEGLTFVKIDESSNSNWQTTSKEGDAVVKLNYTGSDTIFNNSLFEIYKRNYSGNTDMTNMYQTVSIICKVNDVTGYLTNRAEITTEVATDENGTVVEGVTDRDSTPGSLNENDTNLKNYYNYYNVKYGINDTYENFYPGEENGKKEDDTDFETVVIKAPETIDVSGTKTWNDEGNKDKTRPEKITIYLLANGTQVDAKEISEKDGWKYSFTGLAKYDDNKQEIKYTVDESEVEKYTKQVNGYDIVNTYTPPETIDVSGTKTWNDEGNKDKTRPEKITIYLLANGTQVDAKEISEKDGWKYSFTGLAKYDDNKQEIKYTIDESEVEKYTKQINGYDLINTYTTENPETVDVNGVKTWNDANNKDGIRPKAIRVKLLANGEEKTSVITTEEQDWKYSFTELPKFDDNGNEIKYTVDEETVSGYTKKIDGYNITNTHTPTEKLDFSLRKFITEINSVAVNPSRAPQVDVTNLANGTSTTATYNHPKDAKTVNTGDVVTYTIRVYNEGEVDGYVSLIKDEIPEGLQYITNDATNTTYGWKMLDADGKETSDVSKAKYVTTDYLSKEKSENNLIAKFNKETKQLSYKDVKVSFKVVSEDTTGKEIINHAQISKETDSNGKTGTDIDSTPDKWIDGEDDQDIEKVKLTYADLALRKFITKINNEEVNPNRAPQVDVTNLANGTSTTATYNHPKNTVGVSRNDIVVYTLRIYNEGTRDAIAALVKDNIPAGLQFIPSDDLNKKYNWKMLDENNNETTKVSEAKYVVTDYLSNSVIKAYDSTTMDTLDFKDVEVAFKVIAEESTKNEITNYAQISKETDSNGNTIKDRDSTPDEWIDGEDDQDIEKVKLTYADLALRKFITELNSSEVNPNRAPQVDVTNLVNGTSTTATYNHPKDPVEVRENDIVTYTLRIYNEGTKNVYASLVEDDIPERLEFIIDNEINKQYKWKILDENRNEVADISKAKYIVTDCLANDLIKAFDPQTMSTLDYRDVKVSFKVKAPTEKDGQIINYAQITKETDDSGKDVKDRDSTPGKWVDGEDDQDTEIIKLKYFDLALQKWVSKAIVIEDGKEKVTKTGHTADMNPEPVVKVDLKKSKVKNVVVKFEYQIRVENQGQIAGYAKEVSDYIPQGLKFVKDDNQNWREVDGKIVTNQLENTLLQPGESTTISVILTWINDSNNLGLKTNIAEISEDADDHGNSITDIDSTPNNQVDGEDDQDNAPVILTIKTGETTIYTGVIIASIAIIGLGVFCIKKYVLK